MQQNIKKKSLPSKLEGPLITLRLIRDATGKKAGSLIANDVSRGIVLSWIDFIESVDLSGYFEPVSNFFREDLSVFPSSSLSLSLTLLNRTRSTRCDWLTITLKSERKTGGNTKCFRTIIAPFIYGFFDQFRRGSLGVKIRLDAPFSPFSFAVSLSLSFSFFFPSFPER